MESEQLQELTTELCEIQDELGKIYPDLERNDFNIANYQELAEALANQNKLLASKLQEVKQEDLDTTQYNQLKEDYEALFKQNDIEKSQNENHMKVIESLSKQLEIYKCKSNPEIDKKVAALETKSKQEARTLKLENEHLNEMMRFKEEKIVELQQEIDRLKIVMKVEAPTRKLASISGLTKLEKKLDEVAEKGKIEYRVILPAEAELVPVQKDKSLEKILAFPVNSLARALYAQGRMLEDYEIKLNQIGQSEEDRKEVDDYKKRIDELTKERGTLERQINTIMEQEKDLQNRFIQVTGIAEELLSEKSMTRESSESLKKLLALREDWKTSLRNSNSEDATNNLSRPLSGSIVTHKEGAAQKDSEAVEEIDQNREENKETNDEIEKNIEENKLQEVADQLKSVNYELPGQSVEGLINKLRIACKVRDKQIEKLSNEIKSKEKLKKCAELTSMETEEIVNDYKEVKNKYAIEANEEVKTIEDKLKGLHEKVKELQQELAKKNKENTQLKQKQREKQKSEDNEKGEELEAQLEKANAELQKKDEKINELLQIIESSGDKEISASVSSQKREDRIIVGSIVRIEDQKQGKSGKSPEEKAINATRSLSIVTAENEKNRAIIKELMAKGQGAQNKANQLLYDDNVELNNKLKGISEEFESFRTIIEDISMEHNITLSRLTQILSNTSNKERTSPDNKEGINDAIPETVYEQAIKEVSNSRRISILTTEVSFALLHNELKMVPEAAAVYKDQAEETREKADGVYKEYFTEEKTEETTIESLLEVIKRKNTSFKELFKLYEKTIASNETLLREQVKSKMGTGKVKMSPSKDEITELRKQNTEQSTTVKQLLTEIKELKNSISKKNLNSRSTYNLRVESEVDLVERVQGLESELRLAKTEMLECNSEINRRDVDLREKERIIDELKIELSRKENEFKQLEYSSAKMTEDTKRKQTRQGIEQELNARNSTLGSFRKTERISETAFESREKQYEYVKLKEESAELKSTNELLRTKMLELSDNLRKKNEECTSLREINSELSVSLDKQKKIAEDASRTESEVHKLLNQNMSEYKKGSLGHREELQTIKEKLKEKDETMRKIEGSLAVWTKVIQKLKELKQEFVGTGTVSYASKKGSISDDSNVALILVDNLKEQLSSNKRLIEKLQITVNSLQGERQMMFQTATISPLAAKKTNMSAFSPSPAPELESIESERGGKTSVSHIRVLLQKYETWFDNVQESLKIMGKILAEEHLAVIDLDIRKPKLTLKEMRDIIVHGTELISTLRDNLGAKSEENDNLKIDLQKMEDALEAQKRGIDQNRNEKELYIEELESKVKQLASKKLEAEEEIEKVTKEKIKLENLLERQRMDSTKIYDKVKEEVFGKERENYSIKLEAAREEGRFLGQKQQRACREEELKKLNDLLKLYKGENEKYKTAIKELSDAKLELEEYNKKANSEIIVLVDTLKAEQDKQRQLSADLEALTVELKEHRTSQKEYDNY